MTVLTKSSSPFWRERHLLYWLCCRKFLDITGISFSSPCPQFRLSSSTKIFRSVCREWLARRWVLGHYSGSSGQWWDVGTWIESALFFSRSQPHFVRFRNARWNHLYDYQFLIETIGLFAQALLAESPSASAHHLVLCPDYWISPFGKACCRDVHFRHNRWIAASPCQYFS